MPKVLNKKTDEIPEDAVYIGRGGKWGNPFRMGRDGNRFEVVFKYEKWLRTQTSLLRQLDELRGKDLVCFCAPQACHGDVLLRFANPPKED